MKSQTAAKAATYRLVANALEHENDLEPDDAAGLEKLLRPRAVRTALRHLCYRRWAIGVAVAELALDDSAFAQTLADVLGFSKRRAETLLGGRPSGRESALTVVAAAEGVTTRHLRLRIADYRWDAAWAKRFVARRLKAAQATKA